MGIIRLGEFLKKNYPDLFRHRHPFSLRDKFFAVDASSTIYSFLVKTITYSGSKINTPTDSSGNQTGHLIGLLYRALLCKQIGIKTVWVFDGKPPQQKRQIKEQASEKADVARNEGNMKEAAKQSQRTVYVSSVERLDAIKLMRLMGFPVIQAKSEAEAQCAWLSKKCLVEGVIGEDLDTLVLGGSRLLRNFTRDEPAKQIVLQEVLQALHLSYDQFVDFCILCGCDYTSKIEGIGPVKALKLIQARNSIQGVIEEVVSSEKLREKHTIPDDFNYLIARQLFNNPAVFQIDEKLLVQQPFKEQELRQFLLQKEFNEKRIDNWILRAKQFSLKDQLV